MLEEGTQAVVADGAVWAFGAGPTALPFHAGASRENEERAYNSMGELITLLMLPALEK